MTERIISEAREQAICILLDDPSPTVQTALNQELARLGDVGLSLLRKAAREQSGGTREAALRMLKNLKGPDPAAAVIAFIQSLRYDLETGMFLFNRVLEPDLELRPIREYLDTIAQRVRELTVQPQSVWEQCKILNRVLFHEFGFRGNVEDFEDPLNSFMAPLLRRRKGLPISLSILYLLVAERAGMRLDPVALPGHFLVGCFQQDEPFFVDAFDRGRMLTLEELHEELHGQSLQVNPNWFNPTPVGEVLCRVCRNLQRHFTHRNHPRMARTFAQFIQEFEDTYRRHSQA